MLLLAFVLLVLANGFFVATASALVSLRQTRAQQLPAADDRRAAQVLSEVRHLDTYLAATQLGIIIVTLALGWIGQPALASLIEPLVPSLTFLPAASRGVLSHAIAFAIGISILMVLHSLLGNLAPKSIALQRPEQTVLWAARPIYVFSLAVRPALAGLGQILRVTEVDGLLVAQVHVMPVGPLPGGVEAMAGSAA